MPLIEVRNIVKKYRNQTVLSNASFYANQGECIGIVGANGCGKSTLLGILSGSHKPTSGEVIYNGENALKKRKLFTDLVGYVPQENPLMEELSVRDNLKFWYAQSERNLNEDLVNGSLAAFGVTAFLDKTVKKLSGGMKKRLSIACAVANNPAILIMDEPGASLDIVCKEDIKNYLKNYLYYGGTVIITSHEETELKLCNRMYLLQNGQLNELNGNPNIDELMRIIGGGVCKNI